MSRFQKVSIVALVLGAIIFLSGKFILFAVEIVALLSLIGLGVAFPQMQLFGNFICRGSNAKKQIALTFDDGPGANSTPQLLDLLRQDKIPAAFFCVGKKIAANPEIAAQIVREGHLLENHSYAHSNFTNFFSVERLQKELTETQTAIQKTSGVAPRFFRPPMGLSNPRVFKAAKNLNLQVIGWSVRSLDTVLSDPKEIVARIVRRLRPGAIILLHDGNIPAERLVATVQLLLDKLRALGYEVVRLDELLK